MFERKIKMKKIQKFFILSLLFFTFNLAYSMNQEFKKIKKNDPLTLVEEMKEIINDILSLRINENKNFQSILIEDKIQTEIDINSASDIAKKFQEKLEKMNNLFIKVNEILEKSKNQDITKALQDSRKESLAIMFKSYLYLENFNELIKTKILNIISIQNSENFKKSIQEIQNFKNLAKLINTVLKKVNEYLELWSNNESK